MTIDSGKLAFVFPGQGAQKIGMGKALAGSSPKALAITKKADKVLGFSISSICYNGPDEELSKTENTQPALLTASVVALEAFRQKCDIEPDFVAGHSLGEFSAVYAASGLSFEDAVSIVRKRGEYMSKTSGGVMAAVLGLEAEAIESACLEASSGNEFIQPANYNGNGQTVIAGTAIALEKVSILLKEKGAKRVIPLNVSAAFHTPFMQSASQQLARNLDELTFKDLKATLINNVDAKAVSSALDVREGLKKQVTGAVRWTEIMDKLIDSGVTTVIEFGTGKTLLGMLKRAEGGKSLKLLNVEDEASLEKTLGELR